MAVSIRRKLLMALAALMVAIASLGALAAFPQQAWATSKTADEAVAWARSMADNRTYCGECVQLIKKYYAFLGDSMPNPYGNANTYANADRVPNGYYVDNTPSLGAVYVEATAADGDYGHVSIVIGIDSNGTLHTVDSNILGDPRADYYPWTTGRTRADYAGVAGKYFVHPNFKDNSPGDYVWLDSNGWYEISPKYGPDLKLDIENGSSENGANLQLFTANDASAQNFYIEGSGVGSYRIKPKCSGLLLDISGGSTEDGANVQQWGDWGGDSQYWRFRDAGDGYVYIESVSGMYLDVGWGGNQARANVKVWSFDGSDPQKFKLIPVSGKTNSSKISNGNYIFQSATGNRVLDIDGANMANDANYQIYTANLTTAQVFTIERGPYNGFYIVKNKTSGRSMDTYGNWNSTANVIQFDYNGGYGQQWFFEEIGDGYYYIRNAWGYYLDVYNNVDANGQNVQVWSYNGGRAQKWKPIKMTMDNAEISAIPDQPYTGSAVEPAVTVKFFGITLNQGSSYTVSYANNTSPGTATATITGAGAYSGTKTVTFNIVSTKIDISDAAIAPIGEQVYTGSAIEPGITVTIGGQALEQGTDYTVAYANNTDPGTATVIVTGIGDYSGTVSTTFDIVEEHVHQFAISESQDATCAEDGWMKYQCATCEESYTEVIPAFGHTEEILAAVNPTCTESGLTEGKMCSVCGEVLVAQEVVPAAGHVWGEGFVSVQPTVDEEGIMAYVCTVCGEVRTEPIPKLDPVHGAIADGPWEIGYPNAADVTATLYEDGCLVLEGTGDTRAFDSGSQPWADVCRYITSAEFKEGVAPTSLRYFFEGCTSLTEVSDIPDSVTTMYAAFEHCSSMVKAPAIPDSVTNLAFAFKNCYSLAEAPAIPGSVTNIYGAFMSCNLTEAPAIPDSVENMGEAFFYCFRLTEAPAIPSSVTDMSGAFAYCKSLVEAPLIPDSVTDMSGAFNYCTSLTSLPDGFAFPEGADIDRAFAANSDTPLETYCAAADYDALASAYDWAGSNRTLIARNPELIDIAEATIAPIEDQEYTGSEVLPELVVTYDSDTLAEGVDYTASFVNNVDEGTAVVIIVGRGRFTGTTAATFKIVAAAPGLPVKTDGTKYRIVSASDARFILDVAEVHPTAGANVSIWTSNGGANQLFTFTLSDDGYVIPHNVANEELVLDAAGAKPKVGANVSTWSENGGMNQKWSLVPSDESPGFFSIASASDPTFVLDAAGAVPEIGANVSIWYANGGMNQLWAFVEANDLAYAEASAAGMSRNYTGAALSPDITVSLNGEELAEGEDYVVWFGSSQTAPAEPGRYAVMVEGIGDCSGTVELGDFCIYDVPEAVDGVQYHLASGFSDDFVLDVAEAHPTIGANVSIWVDNGGDNQLFAMELGDDGFYVLRNVANGDLVLDAAGAEPSVGANVSTWLSNGGMNQKWVLLPSDERPGYYRIASASNTRYVLDAAGAAPEIGANVSIWYDNGGLNQLWKLVPGE